MSVIYSYQEEQEKITETFEIWLCESQSQHTEFLFLFLYDQTDDSSAITFNCVI